MPKRRGQGEGALFWSASRDRWLGYIELPSTPAGKRRRREVRGKTRAAALAQMRAVRAELADGYSPDRRTTMAQLLERWLQRGLPNLSEAAAANTRWAVDKHLVPALGARRLAELTPEDIEDWLAGLAHSGYSRSTLARLHGTLTRALDWGQARGMVGRNVSKLVTTPTGPTRQRRALTVEESRRLLDAAAADPMGPAIATGLLLGLRPGELIALQWQDVDLVAGTVDIQRYLKTRASRRTLKMPARLLDILIAHVADQVARDTSGDLMFATAAGTPIDRANLRRALRRIAKRADLATLTVYELRHSMVSILSAAGVPLEQVADVAGHASPTVTGSVYRHVVSPSVDAAATAMDQVLGSDG